MTGDHVIESSNIELSNYYKASYEKQFNSMQTRKHIMVLPILDPNESLVGVLEIVSYNAVQNEIEEKFMADFMTYGLGILIH